MTPSNCTEDGEYRCTGGIDEDGEPGPCADCVADAEQQRAYFGAMWAGSSSGERNPEQYRRDMVEGGRGYLLGDS